MYVLDYDYWRSTPQINKLIFGIAQAQGTRSLPHQRSWTCQEQQQAEYLRRLREWPPSESSMRGMETVLWVER